MRDENVVYAKVDLLSEKVRAVLMRLLRATHYTSDLQGLFRGMDGLELEYYEAEAALTALARRGFVRIGRAQEWLHYGRSAYAIPHEMALVMRGLAGSDRRSLDQMFSHAAFQPSRVEALANEELPKLPEHIGKALEVLPGEDLVHLARAGIERFGGIVTRHEFGDAFGKENLTWDSVRFLRAFGGAGLGTVGHLDLRGKGFGVDDDALFFFHEAVERYFRERRGTEPEHDLVLDAHGDLMSDVRTTLIEARDATIKVAKDGAIYRTSRARLGEQLQFPLQPLVDREEIAERVLSIARGLHLAAHDGDGRLALTGKGAAWIGLPLLEKIAQAYALLFSDEVQTLRSHHLRRMHKLMVDLLCDPAERGRWWPGACLALLARNRYLMELARSDEPSSRAHLAISQSALSELGRAAHDLICRDMFVLGLVEVALRGGEAVGVRLSRLGERLFLGDQAPPPEEARALVVNPDFEMLVLPEGDRDDLLHALDRIAVRDGGGEVAHYRLDRARIERAAVAGEAAQSILALLERHARSALPQNVVYSVHAWVAGVRSGTLDKGMLFRANDASVVQAILAHPPLKQRVKEVLDGTVVFFDEQVTEREIARELRALGVYLR